MANSGYNDRRRPPSPQRRDDRSMYAFGRESDRTFDFRAPGGNAPSFPPSRPQDGPRDRRPRDPRRGNNRGNNRGGRGGFKRFATSDRAILRARRSPTPDQMAGMNQGDSRYKALDDVEPVEEADSDAMDLTSSGGSDDEEEEAEDKQSQSEDDDHPRAKRAKIATDAATAATGDEKPKWSNPDPYTSLPPPSETTAPKRDVVQMIRKARIENEARGEASAKADEFISLNFDDDVDNDGAQSHADPDDFHIRGSGARTDHYSPKIHTTGQTDHRPQRDQDRQGNSASRHPRAPPRYPENQPYQQITNGAPHLATHDPDFPPPPPSLYEPLPPPLSLAAPPPPPPQMSQPAPSRSNTNEASKRKRHDAGIDTISEYMPNISSDLTPWMAYCTRQDVRPEDWLHDEILQFYYFVTPRQSERHMRDDLIARIRTAFQAEIRNVSVRAFGSCATNLYLPTGDIDLVVMSSEYINTGFRTIQTTQGTLRRISNNVITRSGLGSFPQIIAHAKVPIIKFKDKKTGLPVDVSFENDSGVKALPTLDNWLADYPALNKMVFVIKQFLKMRGLNEVNTGGLGGFAVICLVVFRLDVSGRRNGRDWAMKNLDRVLLDIFEFYGNEFDLRRDGLDMGRMEYIPKASWIGARGPSKPGRLLIVDPNNPDNDISGGSAKVEDVFKAFREAGKALRTEVDMVRTSSAWTTRRSLLKCVLGADYGAFDEQRSRLERLFQEERGPESGENGKVVDLTLSDDESYSPDPEIVEARPVQPVPPAMTKKNAPRPAQKAESGSAQPRPQTRARTRSQTKQTKKKDSDSATKGKKKDKKKNKSGSRAAAKGKKDKAVAAGSDAVATPADSADAKPAPGIPPPGQAGKADRSEETKAKKPTKKEKLAAAAERYAEHTGTRVINRKVEGGQSARRRAKKFRRRFPGVKCADKLKKSTYKEMIAQQNSMQASNMAQAVPQVA